MKIVAKSINLNELKDMAAAGFGNLLKAVVDIEQEMMAIDVQIVNKKVQR